MKSMKYDRKHVLEKVDNFLRLYNLYSDFEKHYIEEIITHGKFPESYSIEMIREVLDELHFIPQKYNIYEAYINFISKIHNIENLNILEVGGGVIPRLGERISLRQTHGTITVYDPRLYTEESTDKLILKRKKVNNSTPVDGIDLIIGLMPCKGAEDLINLALQNKIDFVLWLCEGGAHGDYFDFFEDEYEWRECMINQAIRGVEINNMGKVYEKKLTEFSKDYPIIYNLRNSK